MARFPLPLARFPSLSRLQRRWPLQMLSTQLPEPIFLGSWRWQDKLDLWREYQCKHREVPLYIKSKLPSLLAVLYHPIQWPPFRKHISRRCRHKSKPNRDSLWQLLNQT